MDEELNIENETPVAEKKKIELSKVKSWIKEKLTPKVLVIFGIALVVLIGAIVGIRYATNNYMTPVRYSEKLENRETIDGKKYLKTGFKYLGAKNGGQILDILCESDDFLDYVEGIEEDCEENYEWMQDIYGDDFKVTYAVEDKIELEKADLRAFQKKFRQYVKNLEKLVEETEDFTASDWGDFADDMGLTRAQAKNFVRALGKMADDIGRVEVTAGYELDVLRTVTGDMLDEPMETVTTIRVMKANGHWIAVDILEGFFDLLDF